MPIYEFQCDACGRAFDELFRSPGERRRMRCPACGSDHVHKKCSTFATAGGSDGESSAGGCGTCSRSSCAGCHG